MIKHMGVDGIPALYIHIPFCRQKCHYCDFNSFSGKEDLIPSYIKALTLELSHLPSKELYSLYFGGGTPSLVDPDYYEGFFNMLAKDFNVRTDAEITIEVNPESTTGEKVHIYKRMGINRLSIGLQSVFNEYLKLLGRIHTYEQFLAVYNAARNEGFNNISIDLLYGIPGMSMNEWEETVQRIVSLKPEHISLYGLSIEEGTRFFVNAVAVNEDAAAEQYVFAQNYLQSAGFKRYEISSFAVPGRESRHNLSYWDHRPYYGIGAGAASFNGNKRWKNTQDINTYIKAMSRHDTVIEEEDELDQSGKTIEKILLGLRMSEGVQISSEEEPVIFQRLKDCISCKLVEYTPPVLKLTDRGMLLANQVWRALW